MSAPQLYSQILPSGALLIHVGGIEPPGPNGPKGTLRMSWRDRRKVFDRIGEHIALALATLDRPRPAKLQRAKVTYLRSYYRRKMDPDNLLASIKPALDALVKEGLIEDDSKEHVRLVPLERPRLDAGPHFQLKVEPYDEDRTPVPAVPADAGGAAAGGTGGGSNDRPPRARRRRPAASADDGADRRPGADGGS